MFSFYISTLNYSVQFPAFLLSKTKSDSTHFSAFVFGQSHPALAALQGLLGWDSADLERENLCAHTFLRLHTLKWMTVSAGAMHKHWQSHEETYQLSPMIIHSKIWLKGKIKLCFQYGWKHCDGKFLSLFH